MYVHGDLMSLEFLNVHLLLDGTISSCLILVPFVALSIPLFLLASSCILIFAGEMPVPLVSRHTLHCLRPVPASQRFFHPNLV